jgi:DNA excision repair protein ERCC-4
MSNQILNYLKELQAKADTREIEKSLSLSRVIPPSEYTILVDSREQQKYFFTKSYTTCLSEGDYSIDKYQGLVAIERKSLDDLVQTLIYNKERFHNELERLTTYEAKCVVVESSFQDLLLGKYVSKALSQSVIGLMMSCSYNYNIPFFFLDSFQDSNRFVLKYLLCFARKKENNYCFPAPKKPLELRLEDTVLSYSLSDFIKEVTTNKIDFKYYINQLKAYKSAAIVLQCNYSDVINKTVNNTNIEDVIISLILDHGISVYFMESKEISQLWIKSHLKRYLPIEVKQPKERKIGISNKQAAKIATDILFRAEVNRIEAAEKEANLNFEKE